MVDELRADVTYALRWFRRSPGFSTAAVLSLALGIGANTALFRLVDAVMLRTLPVRNPGELLVVRGQWAYPRFESARDRNDVFSDLSATYILRDAQLHVDGRPAGLGVAELVSGNYFSMLGVGVAIGRPLTPDDDRVPEASPVAVISYGFWQRTFAGSSDVLGRQIRVEGGVAGGGSSGFESPAAKAPAREAVLTIVGVALPEFFGDTVGTTVDLWVPMMMQPPLMPGRAWLTRRTASWVSLIGRLRPGVTPERARAALTMISRQIRIDELGAQITEQQKRNIANLQVAIDPGDKGFAQLRRQFFQPLLIMTTVAALVLLIACLNVANLLLARATSRRHEMSVRLSLGAGRARLVRRMLTESVLLAGAGGLLGLAVASAGTRVLLALVSTESRPIGLPFEADWRTLAFTAAASMTSALLFGLAPALRGTGAALRTALNDRARTGSVGRSRAAKTLVAVQVGMSLILLVAAGLFLRTLYNLKTTSVGYDRAEMRMVKVDPVAGGYRGDDIGRACVDLLGRLRALPACGRSRSPRTASSAASNRAHRSTPRGFSRRKRRIAPSASIRSDRRTSPTSAPRCSSGATSRNAIAPGRREWR